MALSLAKTCSTAMSANDEDVLHSQTKLNLVLHRTHL